MHVGMGLVMKNQGFLALKINWWVRWRGYEPIRPALARAARLHWLPVVQLGLDTNKKQPPDERKGASNWDQLAKLLGLVPANLYRWRAGKTKKGIPALLFQDLMSVANMTHLPPGELIPDPLRQIASAVMFLCPMLKCPPNQHAAPEAEAYSIYCNSLPVSAWDGANITSECDAILNSTALKVVIASGLLPTIVDAENAIRKVAEVLEPRLAEAKKAAKMTSTAKRGETDA